MRKRNNTTVRHPSLALRASLKVAEQVGKRGKISVSKAMREVGYSRHMSRKPERLKKTKVYKAVVGDLVKDLEEIASLGAKRLKDDLSNGKKSIRPSDVSTIVKNSVHDNQLLSGKKTENYGDIMNSLDALNKAIKQAK